MYFALRTLFEVNLPSTPTHLPSKMVSWFDLKKPRCVSSAFHSPTDMSAVELSASLKFWLTAE